MKATSELHELIRSMSMSEKRFFKIHSGRHVIGEKNNYARLFDAIAKQEQYDESRIKKIFSGETFIKHLSSEKHYLYNHVLESINACNKDKTFLSRYANTLISLELLFNRGLFSHCFKLTRKAKKEAYSREKLSTLLMIIRWETLLYINREDDVNLNRSINEELRIMEMIRSQTKLMQIAFNIQVKIDKGNVSASFIRLQKKLLGENFPKRKEVTSFWAKYYFHSANGLLATLTRQHYERYRSFIEIKKLMDDAPQFIKELPGIYHLNSNNLVNVMFLLGKFHEAGKLVREQRLFLFVHNIHQPNLSRLIFFNANESELFLHYKTKQPDRGVALCGRIENEIRKTDPGTSPTFFDLLFMMAVTQLTAGNYKQATKWLNRILHAEKYVNLRKELLINTRLLFLIVLFESNDILFDSRYIATKRLLDRESSFSMQQRILRVIRMLNDHKKDHRKNKVLQRHVAAIRKATEKLNEQSINKQFDFAEWIDTHLKKRVRVA